MEYIGYIAAIIIGISLGLIGAGGSILTIPVLVYLIGIPAIDATSYSLFIVGTSSFIGSISYFKNNLVSLKTVLTFGIPSVISVFLIRKFILHAIPSSLFYIKNIEVTKDAALMVVLAILMFLSSYSMIKRDTTFPSNEHLEKKKNTIFLILQGVFVGCIVGLIGAGGGFLIIPALLVFARLEMKEAVGTALVIIMLNSWFGFLSDFKYHQLDWSFLIVFSIFASIGILLGSYIAKFISGEKLKPVFGWFVLITGSFIIIKEFFF